MSHGDLWARVASDAPRITSFDLSAPDRQKFALSDAAIQTISNIYAEIDREAQITMAPDQR